MLRRGPPGTVDEQVCDPGQWPLGRAARAGGPRLHAPLCRLAGRGRFTGAEKPRVSQRAVLDHQKAKEEAETEKNLSSLL